MLHFYFVYFAICIVGNASRGIEPIKNEIIHCYLDNDDISRRAVDILQELLDNNVICLQLIRSIRN